jgi:hypothetical protein
MDIVHFRWRQIGHRARRSSATLNGKPGDAVTWNGKLCAQVCCPGAFSPALLAARLEGSRQSVGWIRSGDCAKTIPGRAACATRRLSGDGPEKNAPALIGAGMMDDPSEISAFIAAECE